MTEMDRLEAWHVETLRECDAIDRDCEALVQRGAVIEDLEAIRQRLDLVRARAREHLRALAAWPSAPIH
jgi:hypothetical protein